MITVDPRFDRKRQLANAMIGRGLNVKPPQQGNMHWTQNLASALSSMYGARMLRNAEQEEADYKQSARDTIASALNPDPVQVGEAHGPTQTPKTSRYDHLVSTLAGNPATAETALDLQMQNELAKVKSGGIGQYNPRDYTTDSFARFSETKNPRDLVRYQPYKNVTIGDVPHTFNPVTGQYEPQSTPEKVGESAATVKALEGEGQTTGKGIAEQNLAQYETVLAAEGNIGKVNDLIDHLNSSDAITGLGADLRKNIERTKALIGSDVAAGKVSDTEILDAMMGADVFGMIKALGVGARGLDTPAEREFMRSVLTGTIQLNKDTLVKMAEIRRSVSERAIQKWNERTESGELDNFYKHSGVKKRKFGKSGEPKKPGNIPDDLWNEMTDEEKAAFNG